MISAGPAAVRIPSAKGAANGRNIGRLLFRGFYRIRVIGDQNVPRSGRVIVASNHIGLLDGGLLFSAAPRPLNVVAKSELFEPPFDRLLHASGQIPVEYEAPDRAAVRSALGVLERGGGLGIFPEAHRGIGDFARVRHGVAYLHSRTNAPIVPTAMFGTRKTGMGKNDLPRLRSKLTVVFGEPFTVAAYGDIDTRSTLAAMGESIRQRLADHLKYALELTGYQLPTDDVSIGAKGVSP
ncbi:MAG: 1-acyl-sn-glycerol-3-phosphate acyltransferase [Actinomycetes bacterium]